MTVPCEHCEDGVIWLSRCGGLDPDVTPEECTECYGGNARCCETGCPEHATTVWREGNHEYPLCSAHHHRWKENFDAA